MNVFTFNSLRAIREATVRGSLTRTLACERRLFASEERSNTLLVPKASKTQQSGKTAKTKGRSQGGEQSAAKPKPVIFGFSGDINRSLPDYDLSRPRVEFQDSEDLLKADENVRKILSLEYGTSNDLKTKRIDDITKAVQEHPADIASLEVRIAQMTILIRNQIQHADKYRGDKLAKIALNDRIQKRRKFLKLLRLKDKDKFDWLLRELKIKFVPIPDFDPHETWKYMKPTKKSKRESAAILSYKKIRKEKLDKLQAEFKAKKEEFEVAKEKEFAAFEKELQEMGVNTNVDSLQMLFKEMGLGPPYVVDEGIKSKRKSRLEMIFEKHAALKHKNETPT